jgi:hypothetical protein
MTTTAAPKLGTVWPHGATIRRTRNGRTLGTCAYTPRAINDKLLELGLERATITWACGTERWIAGDQIARQA